MPQQQINYHVTPIDKIDAELIGPRDKSISQRSLIMASIAKGKSNISNLLHSEDITSCVRVLSELGVKIEYIDKNSVVVDGVGKCGLSKPQRQLDCGNSGTALRLLAGLLSGQNFSSVLSGDSSLNKRPMQRIITPLQQMGAKITARYQQPPLTIIGNPNLKSIEYVIPVASAQVQTSLLLAALYANGTSKISTLFAVRDHTQRLLRQFGCNLNVKNNCISIAGKQQLIANDIQIPVDLSSVIFFIVAAIILPGSQLFLPCVGINPGRIGSLTVLQQMGADITFFNKRTVSGEIVADIQVYSSKLTGIKISQDYIATAIDEWPILLVAAATADGVTILRNAKELRYKETDRIKAMADGLKNLGVDIIEHEDGLTVSGIGNNKRFTCVNTIINSFQDHRIAMAFAIAATKSYCDITITDCQNVATSFPDFVNTANKTGCIISVSDKTNSS